MALKFLNKKGWHTGSLRNIENVWKAEQKRDAEQKKLEELQKQIQEEREKAEFRRLQEQAGLIPSQERLDFLYDSGLAVGKGSSSGGFKALESCPRPTEETAPSSSSQQPAAPGALFEEKQQSANDAWRKLHSDPLLMIRQREQEALARIKNNPVKMATIRKSVESKKHKDKADDGDHLDDQSLHRKHSSTKHKSNSKKNKREKDKNKKSRRTGEISSSDDEKTIRSHKHSHKDLRDDRHTGRRYDEDGRASKRRFESKDIKDDRHSGKRDDEDGRANRKSSQSKYKQGRHIESRADKYVDGEKDLKKDRHAEGRHTEDGSGTRRNHDKDRAESPNGKNVQKERSDGPRQRRRNAAPKLSEEERAARLREMQMNAELHEEQRWKRLKKAEEEDAKEASRDTVSRGRSFLDAAQKSVYGAEKGGSSTIEESVRRRAYFSQGKSAAEGNAFVR